MVHFGLQNDDAEPMEEEFNYAQAASAFGATEFAKALSAHLNAHGTNSQKLLGRHGLLERYHHLAQEKADQFQKGGKAEVAEYWRLEARLWDLIHRLYEYRWTHRDQPSDNTSSLAETKITLSWLMDNAPRIMEPEYIQANRWLITRENIKMRKVTGRQTHDPIISELDPDAPLRQGRGLMTEDEENERKLLKQIFAYLRIGDVQGAQQVCRDCNNQWRAASLSGSKKEVLNQNWRRMCFQLARQPQVDRYERAVYGVVCGDLDSVVPVCQTWEDQMWAHFNAIYIWKLEEQLRQSGQGDTIIANFEGVTAEVVLERLINSEHEGISSEAKHPVRCIMGRLITGNLDGVIEYVHSLGHSNDLSQGELAFLLRLSVHIILVMRDFEVPHNQDAANEVVSQYVHALIQYHLDDHVALYAHHLPHQLAIETYAIFLSNIDSDQRRIRQLENAQRFNLDTANIVRKTMKITLESTESAMEDLYAEQGQPVLAVALNDPLTPLDEIQLRALEWVLITGTDDLTLDSLVNGNIIFRRFLLAGHLNAVKALAERVPCTHLLRPEQIHSLDGLDDILGQHALEYAQHSALWELFASFDRWEEFASQYMNAHHTRRDRLAEKQFKNDAKSALGEFMVRAKAMVLSDEGLNAVLDDIVRVDDPESYATLARIRDLYVPEIILRMHEVYLWGAENIDSCYLDDCFDLSAAVADSGAKLYDSFRATNQLEDYVGKIKDLSILSLRPDNLGTGIGTGLSG